MVDGLLCLFPAGRARLLLEEGLLCQEPLVLMVVMRPATALREAKTSLDGAGPMFRSGRPDLVRQELAA
jgi:hypothetical protein